MYIYQIKFLNYLKINFKSFKIFVVKTLKVKTKHKRDIAVSFQDFRRFWQTLLFSVVEIFLISVQDEEFLIYVHFNFEIKPNKKQTRNFQRDRKFLCIVVQ